MHRPQPLQGVDASSPPATRSQSVASDRTSVFRLPSVSSPPPLRRPEPAYVAASAASQIVTSDQDPQLFDLAQDDRAGLSTEPALVTSASLRLVNAFLDHLLYNFLAVARSTSFVTLRPAIHDVLRPTLATEAISGADQELQEYLGAGLEKELAASNDAPASSVPWDLDFVWRRARLRCMVYSSLGDMEEEDEGSFTSEEPRSGVSDGSSHGLEDADIVSPAVAIFLASILEFVGEQILLLAANAASHRTQVRRSEPTSPDGPLAPTERLVVDEPDMEKVALHSTFGRLWRTWRKRVRSPSVSFSRSMSRDSIFARRSNLAIPSSSRRSSVDALEGPTVVHERSSPGWLREVPEEEMAANIALPMSDNDREEIEVPGIVDLSRYRLRPSPGDGLEAANRRPSSLVVAPSDDHDRLGPQVSPSSTPTVGSPGPRPKSHPARTRASSLPTPTRSPFLGSGAQGTVDDGTSFFTPLQSPDQSRSDRPDADDRDVSDLIPSAATSSHPESSLTLATPSSEMPSANGSSPTTSVHHPVVEVSTGVGQPTEVVEEPNRDPTVTPPAVIDHHMTVGGQGPSVNLDREHPTTSTELGPEGASHLSPRPPAVMEALAPAAGGHEPDGKSKVGPGSSALPVARRDLPSVHDAPSPTGIVDPSSDERDDSADPETIGVAHTSNVPLPAPRSSPSNRVGPKRAEVDHRGPADGIVTAPVIDRASHHRETSLDRTGPWTTVPIDGRRLRYDFVSEPPSRTSGGDESSRTGKPEHREIPRIVPRASSSTVVPSSPLNPLQELREDYLESSDDSISPSHDRTKSAPTTKRSGVGLTNGHSPQLNSSVKKSSMSGKASDSKLPTAVVTSGSSGDRASVQRVFTPPTTPRDDSLPKSKRSESVKGSSSPQLGHRFKGVLSRSPDDSDKAMAPRRASQDDGKRDLGGRLVQTEPKSHDAERSFEQLIRSDETIQYTLTPPNMRDMEGMAIRRTDPADTGAYAKRTAPADSGHSAQPFTASRSAAAGQPDSLGAHSLQFPTPSSESIGSSNDVPPSESGVDRKRLPMIPPAHLRSSRRPGTLVARDPLVDRTSTKFFADFIRRTGPGQDENDVSGGLSLPGPPVPSSTGASSPSSPGVPVNDDRTVPARPVRLAASRQRMNRPLAREESPFKREDSSDLVDFIRQGPPGDKQLIPKAIAPFRTTMDSDQFAGLTNGQLVDSMTPRSTASTRNGSRSIQSYNSQTALLDGQGTSPSVDGSRAVDAMPSVQRKQRRVQDPYAIESDNEDVVVPIPPVKPRRDDESLMDFLRSMPPPPPQSTLASAFDSVPKPASNPWPKRDPAGTIKSRFGRADSKRATPNNPSTSHAAANSALDRPGVSSIASYPRALTSRSTDREDSFLALNRSLGVPSLDSDGGHSPPRPPAAGSSSISSGYSDRVSSARPHPAPQARSVRAERERTDDLADFLRNSGPPPSPPVSASTSTSDRRAKGEGGLSKIFRKKKVLGVA